jgi:hypothetical protein
MKPMTASEEIVMPVSVVARELEWEEPSQLTNGCWVADAPFIGYSICHEDFRFHVICEGWNISGDDQDVALDCPTLEAAKAAAQAHYNDAIAKAVKPVSDGLLDSVADVLNAAWCLMDDTEVTPHDDDGVPSLHVSVANWQALSDAMSRVEAFKPEPEGWSSTALRCLRGTGKPAER